jgi:hypothetical protein
MMVTFLGLLLSIVLWLLGIILALVLILLLVPIEVYAAGWVSGLSAAGEASVRWGFGFISGRVSTAGGLELRFIGLRIYRATWTELLARTRTKSDSRKQKQKKEKKPTGKKKHSLSNFSVRRMRKLLEIALRVLHSIRLRGWIAGTIGLDDPSDTAFVAQALSRVNGHRGEFTIEIVPSWTDEVLDIQGEVRVGFWLIRTLLVCIWILLDRDAREALRFA